jgi:DnaJ family protein C protein 9
LIISSLHKSLCINYFIIRMMSGKEGEMDLYQILEVTKAAPAADIKAAYRRLALKFHPDRSSESEAKHRFQEVSRAYDVLSDSARRQLYDRTGQVGDEAVGADWDGYFRALYERVSLHSLDEFKRQYVGSAEEYEDVLCSYVRHQGDMLCVLGDVFFATSEDLERLSAIGRRAINRQIVPSFPLFERGLNAKQLKALKARELKEAEKASKELAVNGSGDDLVKAIQQRKDRRTLDDIADQLAAKYGPPEPKKVRADKQR